MCHGDIVLYYCLYLSEIISTSVSKLLPVGSEVIKAPTRCWRSIMAESSYPSAASGSATEARTNRESIKVNFDKVKKFATTNFTRARQVKKKKKIALTTTPPFITFLLLSLFSS